ncbi:hypothetical protein [Reichenbachiella sp. MALMAid0571]|uniref:hypothetical protein n=1 Tax=Reichenbachiella sp. MALMAid0571 TaxID=3143939 RepID=UPI0032DF1571
MKKIFQILLVVISTNLFAQPNSKETPTVDCKSYELDTKKFKIKFNSEFSTFQLHEVQVDIKEPILIFVRGCSEKLEVISKPRGLAEEIERTITTAYPKIKSLKMKIHIKDIRVLYNELPTLNPRLYVTIDFYVENPKKGFELKHSTTEFIPIVQFIEKPLSKLLRVTIEDFHKQKRYRNPFSLIDAQINNTPKGIYTSFIDLTSKKPTYQFDFKIKSDSLDNLRSKFHLLDKNDEKFSKSVLCFNTGTKSYLNVGYYYPRNYFVELDQLNDEYYFIYDQVYDYTQATKNTVAFGGGLVGALAGSATASKKSPGLIEIKSGKLTTFNKKEMKNILGDQYEAYESYIDNENREKILTFFKGLIENEDTKAKLIKNNR